MDSDQPESGETWAEYFTRTGPARVADRDQAVAVLREKISRLLPKLDEDPDQARRRLSLVFRAAVPEVGADALAVVLADYVIRDRDRTAT
jgi:hypothetical protein